MTLPEVSAERWTRVKQITSDALERPDSDRLPWLAEACAGDEPLRLEVESLLSAHARAGDFLETPAIAAGGAAEAVATATLPGSLPAVAGRPIGPYRIIRELGQGGMAVVYLAERADAAFEKEVAIKIVRGGPASASLTQRFFEERRILATLDHPNIARLLDGGTTEDGLPYVVMERVEGIPLDEYCEASALSLGQRLALFRQVCAAVQYAHQHLVIHRDLKARNILVTADGTPKLLDFGIAKLLEPGLAPGDETRTGYRALTLEAASPEQVRGEPMTVTSDVYSLGVLLYRLLTGQSPYGPKRRTDADLTRAICEEIPVRPSVAAPIERRRQLRSELDAIVLKALRKEPERRYPSVQDFSEDVRRHLEGRPVSARKDTLGYRAGKVRPPAPPGPRVRRAGTRHVGLGDGDHRAAGAHRRARARRCGTSLQPGPQARQRRPVRLPRRHCRSSRVHLHPRADGQGRPPVSRHPVRGEQWRCHPPTRARLRLREGRRRAGLAQSRESRQLRGRIGEPRQGPGHTHAPGGELDREPEREARARAQLRRARGAVAGHRRHSRRPRALSQRRSPSSIPFRPRARSANAASAFSTFATAGPWWPVATSARPSRAIERVSP